MNIRDREFAIEEESITDLIRDLRDETMVMARQQIELAKAETTEKASKVAKNAASIAVWASVLYAGFLFLLTGLTFMGYTAMIGAGVPSIISMWLMPLITGVVVATISGIGAYTAYKKIKNTSPAPKRTISTLKEDQRWLKNKVKP